MCYTGVFAPPASPARPAAALASVEDLTDTLMKECSKSVVRRLSDSNFVRKYFRGNGIDIGGAPDPLALYAELFPGITSLKTWDWVDGDAQFMEGVADETFDFVFASHCLEHLNDPLVGIQTWFRILKPGGHLIFDVPDEDLYEQGVFPSNFNRDHKTTWTVLKERSWSAVSLNALSVVSGLGAAADVRKIEVIDATFRYDLPRLDQSLMPIAECAIECIVRKRPASEVSAGGRVVRGEQPAPEIRRHLNQYRADQRTLREANKNGPPFQDESEV